jgi:hypothetical protein
MDSVSQFYNAHSMSAIISVLCILLFFLLMGKKNIYDPRDYRGIDIEAISQDVVPMDSSTDNSDDTGHRRPRRCKRRASESPPPLDEPKFWMVCPCRSCERYDRPHTRMYSTVHKHLRQHLMGEKYKVRFLKITSSMLYTIFSCMLQVRTTIFK